MKARDMKSLHFLSVSASIPHPDKVKKHGEDASFMTTRAVGVFDGVGSWSKEGIDAGRYSKKLASLTKEQLTSHRHHHHHGHHRHGHHHHGHHHEVVHQPTVDEAVEHAVAHNPHRGSSTLCVAEVHGRELSGTNVGDSGLLVLRHGEPVYCSHDQLHGYNYPHQVSFRDDTDLSTAEKLQFRLHDGDVVVLATDGLWDNVFRKDISRIVKQHLNHWNTPSHPNVNVNRRRAFDGYILDQTIAQQYVPDGMSPSGPKLTNLALDLAVQACTNSHDKSYTSPFALKSKRARKNHQGGKVDDITIVVSMAVHSNERYRASLETKCPGCG